MIKTQHPVVIRGRASLDQNLLPADEFQRRLMFLQEKMSEEGLDALVVFGTAADYGDLCYLTSYVPFLRFGVAVVPKSGDAALLMTSSSRDVLFQRALTVLRDVKTIDNIPAQVKKALEERGITPKKMGQAGGTSVFPVSVYDQVTNAFQDVQFVDFTGVLREMRQIKSVREIEAIRRAHLIAKSAANALWDFHREGKTNYEAAVEAERTAYIAGAQDVRVLINKDEGNYVYPPSSDMPKTSKLLPYVAVEYLGYWADSSGEEPGGAARHALDSGAHAAVEGATTADIVRAAQKESAGGELLPFLKGSYGSGVGLSLNEEPFIASGQSVKLRKGMTLSLRIGFGDSLATDIVLVGRERSERL